MTKQIKPTNASRTQTHIQSFNKRLIVRGNAGRIMHEMSKAENAHLEKLSFVSISRGTIYELAIASSSFLTNLRSSLQTLSIQHSSICLDDARIVVDCIAGNDARETLTKLELEGNMGNAGWATIVGAVAIGSSSLQKLSLKKQHIYTEKALIICDAIKNSHLVELSFVDCTFEEDAVVLIMGVIGDSTIETLILEQTCFCKQAIIAIIDCIAKSKLTKLSLRDTSFGRKVLDGYKIFSIVGAVQKSSLKTLDVRESQFCEYAEDIIAIIKFSSVTKFKFDYATFSCEISVEAIDAIKGRVDFRNISMRWANITDELLAKLCDLLENSSATLTELDLSWSDMSDTQMMTIINAVHASSITSIIFDTNCAREDIIIFAICKLLEGCNIRKIRMDKLTGATMDTLLPWIKQSSLTKFKMHDWSSINKNVREVIRETLKEQRRIANSSYRIKSARTSHVRDQH